MILFGEDFDLGGTVARVAEVVPPEEDAEAPAAVLARVEMAQAAQYAAGYAAGLAEGAARALAERTARCALWSELCASRLDRAEREVAAIADAAAAALARAVFDGLAVLLPEFCARHGAAEIAALARGILPGLRAEPRIVVRVNPHDRDVIADVLGEVPPELRERIVITPTDRVPTGDIQVSWQDGGVARDAATLRGQVADLLRQFGLVREDA